MQKMLGPKTRPNLKFSKKGNGKKCILFQSINFVTYFKRGYQIGNTKIHKRGNLPVFEIDSWNFQQRMDLWFSETPQNLNSLKSQITLRLNVIHHQFYIPTWSRYTVPKWLWSLSRLVTLLKWMELDYHLVNYYISNYKKLNFFFEKIENNDFLILP